MPVLPLSHFSLSLRLCRSPSSSSLCRRFTSPKSQFYPSFLPILQSYPAKPPSTCHVSSSSSSSSRSDSSVSMKSSSEEVRSTVDLVAQDLKNQSLNDVVDGNQKVRDNLKALEDLDWDQSFVRELPGDPRSDNIPREVLHACYTKVSPSVGVENPELVAWSESVAQLLELDPKEFERPDFPLLFSGASPLPGSSSYAQNYGGHQFGMWAGQLGDGRAITLGEVLNSKSQRWELQLKGAGKTPYSRFADGLAVLRSSIREFLCSEAMHSLGIPTTRALCLVTTGKYVMRDMFYDGNPKDEPGAIVCRVAPSFLRFGSFQLHASRDKEDLGIVRALADYAIKHHFPHTGDMDKRYGTKFMDEYQAIMTKKLGLPKYNKQMIGKLLSHMAVDKVDYTNFFRTLSNIKADPDIPDKKLLTPLKAVLLNIGQERKDAWIDWVKSYIQELAVSGVSDEERKASMNSVNPKYVLRNYLCQSAIDVAEQGDFSEVRRLLKVMERPFDDQPGMEIYARLPPAWAYRHGVCMLSCSS